MAIESINPATGQVIQTYQEISPDRAAAAVDDAHEAWRLWRKTSFSERAAPMKRTAGILRQRKEDLARLMAIEMGKPIRQGVAEAEKCALVCDYYAEKAESFLADEHIQTEASKSYTAFEPVGVVLAIMPWNFPLWQVFRFAAPALMAGNACVLKHASNVPGCALAIEEILKEAGFPRALFQSLLVGSRQVQRLIEHPLVRAVTLTGSTSAGKAVAAQSGAVLKKTVLELGGSDPYIVLEDADIAEAARACVSSRLINSGQSCIAAKRFIVTTSVLQAFTDAFITEMKAKRMGDPLLEETDIGPQARIDLRDSLHKQVRQSISHGARVLLCGEIPPASGAYYPPTVLSNVKAGMPAYDEELFGPVAAIIAASDEDEAIRIANDTVFGLGSAVFTSDLKRGERIARELNAGQAFINAMVSSDPRLPFGGVKDSGYGRELGSHGIKEFVNIKTIYLK